MFGFALGDRGGRAARRSHRLLRAWPIAALYPLLIGVNAVPKAAFVPILVVWFGIGNGAGDPTAFLICFFPIAVNIATGLATSSPSSRTCCARSARSKLDILRKVGLPRSMPYFFASLKVAITLAFVGTVMSETRRRTTASAT